MTQVRSTNVRRVEVDTVDEVAKTFSDVYRVLREQQNEIDTLLSLAKKVQAPVPVTKPVVTDVPEKASKSTKESKK